MLTRRIEAMIADLTAKIAERKARQSDPNSSGAGEEDEDVKAMLEIHEKVSECLEWYLRRSRSLVLFAFSAYYGAT